ncbi:MAG: Uroporphyrinogen decarboxylase [Patescibacteria group bacterium]|nr:Uroporphyrinogen decarboxylase [Patescibacteria group bacterium]
MSTFNDTFLRAARGEPTEHVPVWFMRQAGRSLPGYRELRKKYDMLTLAQTPELAAQVSLEPVERLGVDAAILFADIMLLPIAMGVGVRIIDAVGPIIDAPVTNARDVAKLRPFEPANIEYLQQTIKLLRKDLNVPLIGFSAAPFTLASYLIEGEPTRKWLKTKRFMFEQTEAWNQLMETLSDAIIGYLRTQVNAGAQALQLFDSWVGCLAPADYRDYVLPHVQRIFAALADTGVPRIHFGTDTAGLLTDFASVDCEVIGLDWRVDLDRAKQLIGPKAIQGNLDPAILLSDQATIHAHVDQIFKALPSRTGYIFNFGHGVLPETDDAKLKQLVEYIHAQ